MTAKSLAHAFSSLTRQRQGEALAMIGHALTIDARDTYIAGTEAIADPVRLRGFNEIQHRVFGLVRGILQNTNDFDESFASMLIEARKTLRATTMGEELEKLESGSLVSTPPKRRAG